MFLAPFQLDKSSPFATASPPALLIVSTTSLAGPASAPVPSTLAPRSLTMTFAPCAASLSACSRPTPRPAPVTIATLPSHKRAISSHPLIELLLQLDTSRTCHRRNIRQG